MSLEERDLQTLRGRRIVVLGLARTGEAAARALNAAGAQVAILDAADDEAVRERAARIDAARVVLGRSDPEDLGDADLVVTSPGIPWHHPWLAAARERGIAVWGDVELAFRLGMRPVVGITGTNGKTTTTEMVAAILNEAGRPAVAAGNIGAPILDAPAGREIVAELSSFQLQATERFRVPVAVLLNLAPDHIDWHGTFTAYAAAKGMLFANLEPSDTAVVHVDPACLGLAARSRARLLPFDGAQLPARGAGVRDGSIVVGADEVLGVDELATRTAWFVADAVAAAAAGIAAGVPVTAARAALTAYRPRAHRFEHVATIEGVRYINDSKATDPHATLAALAEAGTVVLIAGGMDRSRDLAALTSARPLPRAVVAIGEAAAEVERVFTAAGVRVVRASSIEEAVRTARPLARAGDAVLLSPACASLDMFTSYEERGEAFRDAVRRLEGSTS